jgi:hypothetical protein
MSNPVWVLSVDLQTKTAVFQTGMADAANAARGAFKDIKQNAGEMADGVESASSRTNYSMTEARHGVMMLGEEFGVHLPRGLTTFIASLGPVGAAMEMAFPFLAIILGATLLIEHLVKVGEAAEKAAEAGNKLGDDMTLGMDHAKEALLDAQIEARALAGLPAWDLLAQKLQLKDADKGIENLNRLDKRLEDLLKAHGATSNWNPFNWLDHSDDLISKAKALQESLHGKGDTEQIDILNNALTIQSKSLSEMEGQSGVSAVQLTNQRKYVDLLREQTGELQTQADASTTEDQNKQTKDRSKSIADFAKEQSAWETHLDSMYKDYEEYISKSRAAKQKQAEDAEHEAELETAASRGVLQSLEESQKKEIEGYNRVHEMANKAVEDDARLAESQRKVFEIGIMSGASSYLISKKQEQAGLREVLEHERTDLIAAHQKEVAEQQAFIAQMNTLATQTTGNNQIKALEAAAQAQDKLSQSARQFGQAMAQNQAAIQGLNTETLKLNSAWTTFFAQSNQSMLGFTGEMNGALQQSIKQMESGFSQAMAKSIVEGKNLGQAMQHLGVEISESMISALIRWGVQDVITKAGMKATAASLAGTNATASMAGAPFPVDLSAPAFGASMMGAAMGFAEGGIVPGVEKGDTVPAMLTPGEGVIPKQTMENLKHAAQPSQTVVHLHYNNENHVNTIDGDGMKDALEKNHDVFAEHVHKTLRAGNH